VSSHVVITGLGSSWEAMKRVGCERLTGVETVDTNAPLTLN
jgi:hypothetical protein